jgi:outer membrane protein OmpA-like peptidoglycan-associated protein
MARVFSYKEVSRKQATSRWRQLFVLVLSVLMGILISVSVNAQHVYHKQKARFFKSKFKTQINNYTNACDILERKRTRPSRHHVHFASTRSTEPRVLSGGTALTGENNIPKPRPKPENEGVKPVALARHGETPSPEKLERLHDREDEVLKENHLPAPTSEQHRVIREMVANQLKEHKDNEPIELAPLYFNFAEDEFSVVDMNPFLIAVEFALQGRTILIEGHTDSHGKDDYNVQLSLKRVEKIRQLMHDMGVPDDRISVIGYGEEIAQHDNSSSEGRQMNRRVDFKAF